jgi:hypothetical protein
MNTKHINISLRIIYALLIAAVAIFMHWEEALFDVIIFTVTLPVLFLASKDRRYHIADSFFMLLFIIPLAMGLSGNPLISSLFGLDKIFHFVAGIAMAVFFSIFLDKHISNRKIYYLAIISFSAALGAGWEIFEWVYALVADKSLHYVRIHDTMLDIIVDTLGAIAVVIWIAVRKVLK